MLQLSSIGKTVAQVAEAVTAAIGIESEVVDASLKIIGGTGRYTKKIGAYEEEGDLNSPYIYAGMLRSGREYVCMDVTKDQTYQPVEEELAEIACPIQVESQIVGLIGLIAFTKEQQQRMEQNCESLLNFLRRMADLIASKLMESQSSSKLAVLLESMPEGLIAIDFDGRIFACNFTSEILLHRKREQLIGQNLAQLFPREEIDPANLKEHKEKEIIYLAGRKKRRLMFTMIPIPECGTMLLFQDYEAVAVNAGNLSHLQSTTTFEDILGTGKKMLEAKERAYQVAEGTSTVLITGESGTGKELFARAIHAQSNRRDNAFIAINCGAIPDSLLESELFGYEKGAFTGADKNGKPGKFELANHGTLFLDEIGDMPLHMQVKLLRALQNRTIERVGGSVPTEIDVRIISATNKDLEKMIERKEFRQDLYFRLNVIPLHIPPLRERLEDIEPILMISLKKFNGLMEKEIAGFEEDALNALKEYDWPGNVRELENAIEYAVNMEKQEKIQLSNLPDRIKRGSKSSFVEHGKTLKEQTEHAQRLIILECLKHTGVTREGKRRASEILDISESSLYRKMRELGIPVRSPEG